MNKRYVEAKGTYEQLGVDVEQALHLAQAFPVSMHCWQGDDVVGFDGAQALSGGIQTTGNYPGKARTPKELMQDMDQAMRLIPGTKRINLHASYAIFEEGKSVDRDALEPKHFQAWLQYAKERNLGIDFNPTLFSHELASEGTLSSTNKEIQAFWIRHCKACIRISEYFAKELQSPCTMNIWIPDGLKDVPGDRMGPRRRFMEALDEILSSPYDKQLVLVCLESKVFGIGMESYTVGSAEFTMNYAKTRDILPLMDNGHYHPTELVSDKLASMLLFHEQVALHVTRGVRWDSDHVVLFDDETKEIAKEIVYHDALDRVKLGLDFFDASINRIAAWTIGMRNMQKAMLYALLQPKETIKALQDQQDFTSLMVLQEELKTYPFGDIWDEYCSRNQVPIKEAWFEEVKNYETEVLSKRG